MITIDSKCYMLCQLCQWICLFVKYLVLIILGDQGGDVVKTLAPVGVRVPGAAATKMDIGRLPTEGGPVVENRA